ncbi:MAG: glycosyltransferase family 2 protein [Bacillota bacterium]
MEVAAIIPAYNEENTIGSVITTLKNSPDVDRILVVSDGSEDDTVNVALDYGGVEVIDLLVNRGKGGAIKAGLERCDSEIILILDADLIGLSGEHIAALLQPVKNEEAPMSIGIFEKGRMATDIAQKMAPFLSGQRALKRELLERISNLDISRFGIEVGLHQYIEDNEIEAAVVQLPDLSHVMKEEKLGFWKGFLARGKMYWEIIRYVTRFDSDKN